MPNSTKISRVFSAFVIGFFRFTLCFVIGAFQVEALIVRLSHNVKLQAGKSGSDHKKNQLVFLINNYDMILAVLAVREYNQFEFQTHLGIALASDLYMGKRSQVHSQQFIYAYNRIPIPYIFMGREWSTT